jgi:type I restriction enzyme M protein
VYDPTCGTGSLHLKVADEARTKITIYGQEKDGATSGLARMNMILHGEPEAVIMQGNTLTDPKYTVAAKHSPFVQGQGHSLFSLKITEAERLVTFDYVVANPPFSDKRWSTGLNPSEDPFERFGYLGIPPAKQGDYAYLLHILKSMKSSAQGACILPHGVLFRGNAEADIRRNLVRRGYIKAIIGLPANLFYGTGIPACIIVLDKEHAHTRKGIFMIDASSGYMKDGNKNRLRDRDIHRIVDVFTRGLEVPKYARMVGVEEIEKNDYNLNLPRYIDSQEPEDIQDIEGHLKGGIPERDIDALEPYWSVCSSLKASLFRQMREGYLELTVPKGELKQAIYTHPEFAAFISGMNGHFSIWKTRTIEELKHLEKGCHPKSIIQSLSEHLLEHYADKPLIDRYAVYQHLMDYWTETMQDDCYLIAADGWKAETCRITEKDKKGKEKDRGWVCDLVPKPLIVARFFAELQELIIRVETELESRTARMSELEEEHGGEECAFAAMDKVNKANVAARLKEIKADKEAKDEADVLREWLKLSGEEAELKKMLRDAEANFDAYAYDKYSELTVDEIKTLVVDDKWLAAIATAIHGEMDRISQNLTRRVKELAERYETPLPDVSLKVAELEAKVHAHLERMGFSWR